MEGKENPKQAPTAADPILFETITYTNPRHIRYLDDYLLLHPNPNYKKLDLEAMDSKSVQVNEYDSIYEKLYKKVARDGYIQKTKDISKKSKRGGDENFYNSSDPFIDDERVEEKDTKQTTYSDFKAVHCSLENFYKSSDYKPEVVMEQKRKPERMEISEEEKEKIIRKVKNKLREEEVKDKIQQE